MQLQKCNLAADQFVPNTEDFFLRVLHYGGDYGNFISYAVEWLVGATDIKIQDVITETGASHLHEVCYLHRECNPGDSNLHYIFYGPQRHNLSVVRTHWVPNAYPESTVEVKLLSRQGPTVVVDYTGCILELINNRRTKMPIQFTLDAGNMISMHRYYANVCWQVATWPNVFVFKMSKLSTDPAQELLRLISFLNIRRQRTNTELQDMLQYWQSRQKFLGRDQQVRTLLQNGVSIDDPRINNDEREMLSAFDKYDYKFL